MPAPLTRLLDHPLFEKALLRAASRAALARSDAARERMKPWVSAARARYLVALELRDRETQGVALGLLREAAFFALCALSVAESESALPSPSAKVAWDRFSAPPGAPEHWSRVRGALGTDDPLAVERLDPGDAQSLRAAAEESVAWLLSLAEVRSPAQLGRARWLRTGLWLASLIVLCWAGLSYWFALSVLSAR